MSKHIMEFDISNPRAKYDGKAKIRIWKEEHNIIFVTTVVDGNKGFPFEIDPPKVPDIIRANSVDNADALIEEFNNLPVSA